VRFREANERLLGAVADHLPHSRSISFLCECANDECLDTVEVTLAEWEAVASEHNHCLMLAGHQQSEGEEGRASVGKYQVARKPG
jgi:hypothetical protein